MRGRAPGYRAARLAGRAVSSTRMSPKSYSRATCIALDFVDARRTCQLRSHQMLESTYATTSMSSDRRRRDCRNRRSNCSDRAEEFSRQDGPFPAVSSILARPSSRPRCARRSEEISLEVELRALLGVYSRPDRDPRGQTDHCGLCRTRGRERRVGRRRCEELRARRSAQSARAAGIRSCGDSRRLCALPRYRRISRRRGASIKAPIAFARGRSASRRSTPPTASEILDAAPL